MSLAERQARYAEQFLPLIGPDAVAALKVTVRWQLWAMLGAYLGVGLSIVLATAPGSVRWVTLFPAWLIDMALMVQWQRYARRTGLSASAYLAPRVGFPIRLTTTYRSVESWNRAIDRARTRWEHDHGSTT